MKILYDNHVYNWQKVGGISKYYTELISHLKNYDVKVLLPVFCLIIIIFVIMNLL